MPSLFSRIRGKDGQGKLKSKKNANAGDLTHQLPSKPQWDDAYTRTTVEADEVQDLIRRCTEEIKARALDHPFLLLPFRPTSDPSAVRTFIRHFFDGSQNMHGDALTQELRMIEPMVISGVLKWCWSRLQGGVVGWDAYELFKAGENDSHMARDAFSTFIPLSVDSDARSHIIFDLFDLLSAIAAHGKMNGFGGRKLSRMASWWAFEQKDSGNGFDGGYKQWLTAADATSHLFFAYLRSLAPQATIGGISMLPMSLQKLLQETEYPPQLPSLMQSTTNRVAMIVDTVSPTPFALLRRANHFQYRDDDKALQEFSEFEDPVKALSEECRRVLKAISSANQSQVSSSKHSTSLRDASWSRFEDIGFGGTMDEEEEEGDYSRQFKEARSPGLRTTPANGTTQGRPTTPSWADFLSSGFVDEPTAPSSTLLPPDKILPPIETNVRQRSAQSHRPRLEGEGPLEPGELASITKFDLDDAFWWVWMSSLAPEETAERKSAFGRCAVVETLVRSGRWIVMEEIVKGAAPEPDAGAYIAEKKGFFSWTRRNKGISRSKSTSKHGLGGNDGLKPSNSVGASTSKTSIGPDQQARIHAAAQKLHAKEQQQRQMETAIPEKRGRTDAEVMSSKTNSVMTLQPVIMSEANPAMKWATKYDKETIRGAYLANTTAGRGVSESKTNGASAAPAPVANGNHKPEAAEPAEEPKPKEELPPTPDAKPEVPDKTPPPAPTGRDSPLPPTPNEQDDMAAARDGMMSPEPTSPESRKQKKLHKEEKKSVGGLKKLFSRSKNRSSKLPENAATDVSTMLEKDEATKPAPAPPATVPEIQEPTEPHPALVPVPEISTNHATAKSPTDAITPADTVFATPMEEMEMEGEKTPTQETEPAVNSEPTFEPPAEDDQLSRIDTNEEADREFSRFDQGPLTEQPAFIPDDGASDDERDATPPPIARHPSNNALQAAAAADEPAGEETSPRAAAVPTTSDFDKIRNKWAQHRELAEASKDFKKSYDAEGGKGFSKTDEYNDARVERIKARVAELTGNIQQSQGPPPPRR